MRDWVLENAGLAAQSLPITIRILWMMDRERWEAYQRKHTPNNLEEGLELVLSYLEAAISKTAAQVAGPPAEGKCLLSPSPPAEGKCLLSPSPPAEGKCLLSPSPPAEGECLLVLPLQPKWEEPECPQPKWEEPKRPMPEREEHERPTPEREEPECPTPEWEEPEHPTPEWEEPEHPTPELEEPERPTPEWGEPELPQPKRDESVRPQPKREESVRPQPKREESMHPQPKEREVGASTALGPKLPAEGEYLLVPPPPAEDEYLLVPTSLLWEDCLPLPPPPAEGEYLLVPYQEPEGEELQAEPPEIFWGGEGQDAGVPQQPLFMLLKAARRAPAGDRGGGPETCSHCSSFAAGDRGGGPETCSHCSSFAAGDRGGGPETCSHCSSFAVGLDQHALSRATTGRGADSIASHGHTEASLPSPSLCPGLLGF
ncbi:UNVERIFIED_CONTAM: hypothetical protein FKN15_037373 [Acipenser sinensis]